MAPDEILDRLRALVPELEAEGNDALALSVREVIALLENEPPPMVTGAETMRFAQ